MKFDRLGSSGLAIQVAMAAARVIPERPLLYLADRISSRVAREVSPSALAVRANQSVVRGLPKDDPEIDRAVQAVFHNAGRGQVDLFRALGRGREALLRGCDISPELVQRIESARGQGRGLVLVGPHIGAFDFFMLTIAARGYPVHAISPADPAGSYRLQNSLRTKYGAVTMPASPEAVRTSINQLLEGGILVTGMDRPASKGERIEFFGREAFLPTGFAKLAIRTNSLLLPAMIVPDRPNHYQAEALEILEPPKERTDAAVTGLAREVLRQMEPVIREYADHWLMFFPVWPDA
ncbi:MAG: lysophospholipid acyltransferase family protein [Chloroflexi bacterium]|nr:lysophospholipid acyltransferase family protein [Chloroflexota bacterium]